MHSKQSSTSSQLTAVRHSRTLVLCFDGTGDEFDADNSNVVQFFSMLKKDDPSRQMAYYQTGIGTYTNAPVTLPVTRKLSQVVDAMIAWNLDSHVMGGYEFLMQHYTPGDRICLFGFSRGAYTARSLAGMLHKVGLLPPGNIQQIPFAYKMYTTKSDKDWKQPNQFKRAFSMDVDIEFVGVWDTVDSVGVIHRILPFSTSNTIIRHFRHAVALDERRAYFKANLWNRPNARECKLGLEKRKHTKLLNLSFGADNDAKEAQNEISFDAADKREETDVKEVWFAGCHCDIGGGSIPNGTPHKLSRIPLRWMIRECARTGSGVLFDPECLKTLGLNPDRLTTSPPALPVTGLHLQRRAHWWKRLFQRAVEPRTVFTRTDAGGVVREDVHARTGELEVGSEEEEELQDALAPRYDRLHKRWGWWVLEVLPLPHHHQRDDGWVWSFGWNWGRGREVPERDWKGVEGVNVHRTVLMRMKAKFDDGKEYKPKALFKMEAVRWVD